MTATVSITESQIFTALRTVLLSWLPESTEIVRGQQNRVPEPTSADFIVMLPVTRTALATNLVEYQDASATNTQSVQVDIQLDIHGPNSPDNTQVILTLFRTEAGVEAFEATGYGVTPLYASDPRQLPFIDGEEQFEDRWTFDLSFQVDFAVTTPQDFATSLGSIALNPT
jgi:hypothetical protein